MTALPLSWADRLERTLQRYEEPLLRQVADRLIRPRNQWPVDDLIARCVATASEITIIDRRLRDLEPAQRQLLALMGHSRQPLWAVGNLVEMLMSLGHADGLAPLFGLLQTGLLYPHLPLEDSPPDRRNRLKSFDQWVAFASPTGLQVFAHPLAMSRALGEPLPFNDLPEAIHATNPPLEADGLDWPLRLAVLWQQVAGAPLRRTQQGEFFKRDFDRLLNDPLLNAAAVEGLPGVPAPGFLAAELAVLLGVAVEQEGELRAGRFPPQWQEGLNATLAAFFEVLPRLRAWDPLEGNRDRSLPGNPFPSAGLLALLLLGQLGEEGWTTPEAIQEWLSQRHPFWNVEGVRPSRLKDWMTPFLLGLCYQLRIVQAARTPEGEWVVRLSGLGKWLLALAEKPPVEMVFPRTLVAQPNLEIIAYRQGLTPALIDFLARTASFQSLGSVCTLQLGPDSVYRALESGLTFESILQTLEQHGTRSTPPAVIDLLRTWSNKRERITVYPSAALLEFSSKEDLDTALARGFPGIRVTDRLAVVASEASIDYSLFRLTSSRDYAARPEKCVEVGEDGVTLTVDLSRSDLLLDSELSRFAEHDERTSSNGRRTYRLTPESMTEAREKGVTAQTLETWFQQRAGESAPPAALLLLGGEQRQEVTVRRQIILHVGSEQVTDGLMQWPASRDLIEARLGATALSVAEENVEKLRKILGELGMKWTE